MIFTPTDLPGAFLIDIEPGHDERGFFARTWCAVEFARYGLKNTLDQCNVSFNKAIGTLRGMHYQLPPNEETKIVRCTAGAIYDVIVDLRRDSATYMKWVGVELTAQNRRMLYIPGGVAHGFLTLSADSEVFYQIAGVFVPAAARGLRWDDPAIGITWPGPPRVISSRDREYPNYDG
jgi:dTDP-4-dehydrorhamnose 3,5-epimerase